MSGALRQGRPIRYYPGKLGGKKPPERAGIYDIYTADGISLYVGKSITMRRRIAEHKRDGKIPEDGYVDCTLAKDGITIEELNAAEREKIAKHQPKLNKSRGGEGPISPRFASEIPTITEELPQIYETLGYAEQDDSGEIRYKKELKSIFFMIIELIVKIIVVLLGLLSALLTAVYFSWSIDFTEFVYTCLAAIFAGMFIIFKYIRRSKFFASVCILSILANIAMIIL